MKVGQQTGQHKSKSVIPLLPVLATPFALIVIGWVQNDEVIILAAIGLTLLIMAIQNEANS